MAALGEDLSEEDIENMVKEADKDGDNRIDFNGEPFPNLSLQVNPDTFPDLTKTQLTFSFFENNLLSNK